MEEAKEENAEEVKEESTEEIAAPTPRTREEWMNFIAANGVDSCSHRQILELLIRWASSSADTSVVAENLIDAFGCAQNVLGTPEQALQQVPGVTPQIAFFLHFCDLLWQAIHDPRRSSKPTFLKTTQEQIAYFQKLYTNQHVEKIMMAYLDENYQLLHIYTLGEGCPTHANINPRLLAQSAVRTKELLAIVAHNHPRVPAKPSLDDIDFTKFLFETLKMIGIRLIDHIIIGKNSTHSMRLSGDYGKFAE